MAQKKWKYDVVVAGYICVDMTPRFVYPAPDSSLSEILKPGKLVQVGDLDVSLGGVVPNTGIALQVFGANVALMGLVGVDTLGDIVAATLDRHGLAAGIQYAESSGTGYSIVIAPPGIDRVFIESPGCNGVFTAADVDYEVIEQSRLFHFGYPPLMESMIAEDGAELEKLFRNVKQRGVATSLDMAMPDPQSPAGTTDWMRLLSRTLPYVDIFTPSIEELLFMMDHDLYEQIHLEAGDGDFVDVVPQSVFAELTDKTRELGARITLIKAGHRGMCLQTATEGIDRLESLNLAAQDWAGKQFWLPVFPRDVSKIKNACGAGDCAIAGFLAAMLYGADPETAARYATLAGRDNLYGTDAISSLRDWQAMTKDINETC